MPHSLQTEVSQLACRLIDAFGLTFTGDDSNVDDALIRWFDYRLRYIEPNSRFILKSNGFDSRVPPEAKAALESFVAKAQAGEDLNPYQTKTIKGNDTSGAKRQLRTDGLWADWGIFHAHLTEVPLGTDTVFSARSDWLLFFMVLPDSLALIDVRSHDEKEIFQAVDLIEKAIRSWPDITETWQIKSIVGLARSPSTDPESVKLLRKAGVTQMLQVDGHTYLPPGMGMTTAATSSRVSLAAIRLRNLVRQLGDALLQPESAFMKEAANKGNFEPTLTLDILPDGRLAISAREIGVCAPFPAPPLLGDVRADIEYLFAPPWARTALVKHLGGRLQS